MSGMPPPSGGDMAMRSCSIESKPGEHVSKSGGMRSCSIENKSEVCPPHLVGPGEQRPGYS